MDSKTARKLSIEHRLIFVLLPLSSRDPKTCEEQLLDSGEHQTEKYRLIKEDDQTEVNHQNAVNQAIDQTIGNQTISNQSIDDQTIGDRTISDQTLSDQTISDQTTSDQTINEITRDQTVEQTIDGQTIENQTISGKTTARETIDTIDGEAVFQTSSPCQLETSTSEQIISSASSTSDQSASQSCAQSTSQSANQSFDEHNRCFIQEERDSSDEGISTCDANERNYNWCRLTHKEANSSKDLSNQSLNNRSLNKHGNRPAPERRDRAIRGQHCMMEHFADGINVSGISRRRILANISDYEADGQFMCSTLIKSNEDKNSSKPKFQDLHEADKSASISEFARGDLARKAPRGELVSQPSNGSIQLSNRKLELISKQMKEVEETIQKQMNGNKPLHKRPNSMGHRKSSTNTLSSAHKSSTNSNSTTGRLDDEQLIYDPRKPFSDLSSIEEARLDNLRNNLRAMQMDTIDKRRIFNKYFNEDGYGGKLDLDSIADENLRSELYNSKHSTLINQIKKIQNQHNNQVVHSLMASDTEDIWYCKTKLYDDTLDEIVRKWASLDNEIWAKVIIHERNRRVAKAYIRLPYLIVTGSKIGFDGYSIGLNGFENIYRDQETDFIVKNLEKGVRIKIDNEGNLILRKMTHLSVQIKDWLQQLTDGTGSLSDDVIALQGKIPYNKPIKVFDIDRFANNLRVELEKPMPNRRRLAKQCIIPIAFGKNVFNLLNSPSWLMVVNVHALRMIESITRIPEPDYGLSTLEENINQICLKEESSGSSCSNGLSDSMENSNSEEDQYLYSGFTGKKNLNMNNHHIYSSI